MTATKTFPLHSDTVYAIHAFCCAMIFCKWYGRLCYSKKLRKEKEHRSNDFVPKSSDFTQWFVIFPICHRSKWIGKHKFSIATFTETSEQWPKKIVAVFKELQIVSTLCCGFKTKQSNSFAPTTNKLGDSRQIVAPYSVERTKVWEST